MKPSVSAVGRLIRDPELTHTTKTNTAVCKFSIACDGRDKSETVFLSCKCFGAQAEFVHKYFLKGKPIHIVGELAQWEDESKDKRRHTFAEVSRASFVPGDVRREESASRPSSDSGPGADADDDDVPF
jgi:Single-stranded DNA-binding protein